MLGGGGQDMRAWGDRVGRERGSMSEFKRVNMREIGASLTKMLRPKGLAQRAKWRKPTEKGWEPRMQDIGGIKPGPLFSATLKCHFFELYPFLMGNLNISCEQALHLGDRKMTYYVSGT